MQFKTLSKLLIFFNSFFFTFIVVLLLITSITLRDYELDYQLKIILLRLGIALIIQTSGNMFLTKIPIVMPKPNFLHFGGNENEDREK